MKARLHHVALLALLNGCASFHQFQTAEVVPAGTVGMGVSASGTAYQVEVIPDEPDTVVVPQIGTWARFGLAPHTQIHTNFWVPLGATVGGKYQLLGEYGARGPQLSLGADVGYMTIKTSTGTGDSVDEASIRILDTYLPIYTGWRAKESFAVYVTPKFVGRTLMGETTVFQPMTGATAGMAVGSRKRLTLEATGLVNLGDVSPILQFGLGYQPPVAKTKWVGAIASVFTKEPTDVAESTADADEAPQVAKVKPKRARKRGKKSDSQEAVEEASGEDAVSEADAQPVMPYERDEGTVVFSRACKMYGYSDTGESVVVATAATGQQLTEVGRDAKTVKLMYDDHPVWVLLTCLE